MSEKKYVLRARGFGYNDEYYSFDSDEADGKINSIFNDKELAVKAWKELERKTLPMRPLSSIDKLFERDDAELKELDQFLFERSGIHLICVLDNGNYVVEEIEDTIATLDENVVFEFLEKADLLSFYLVEFDDEEQFYVAWMSEMNVYRVKKNYGEGDDDELYFWQDRAQAVKECCEDYIKGDCYSKKRQSPLIFEGTLESLSDSPALLRTAIASHKHLFYDEEEGALLVDDDAQALAMILPLLKNPPLEIRSVTIDELCAIQAAMTA